MTTSSLGAAWARAIGTKDDAGLADLLADSIDFRALTPGRAWEASDTATVDDIVFGHWFEESDVITEILEITEAPAVEDTAQVRYRFAITNADGRHTCEQTAYYRPEGDRIGYIRVLCSGYRRVVE